MLTQTQLKILAFLIDHKEKLCGIRELSKNISVAYYLVHKNIHDLKKKNIITLQRAGKTDIIRINEKATSLYLIEAENFKRDNFYRKYPDIKMILNKIIDQNPSSFFILLVFGSYTKQPRKDSDLDLLVIAPNIKQEEMQKTISSIGRTSIIKIHETIVDEESFASLLLKKELNVALEARNNHVIIYGDENYYKLLK
jgi:hypothetical protein